MEEPFNLQRLDSIIARIMTRNDLGDSEWSEIGGTAFIPVMPSEPIKLKRVEADCKLISADEV